MHVPRNMLSCSFPQASILVEKLNLSQHRRRSKTPLRIEALVAKCQVCYTMAMLQGPCTPRFGTGLMHVGDSESNGELAESSALGRNGVRTI
jgi:hypothetical protein